MISGLWSNSNLDDGKNTREDALKSIENTYNDIVASIYSEPKTEIDFKSDPFFAAMKIPGDPESGPVPDRTTTTDEIKVDQTE